MTMQIGVNIGNGSYWDRSLVFSNLAQSRYDISQPTTNRWFSKTGREIKLNIHGWPENVTDGEQVQLKCCDEDVEMLEQPDEYPRQFVFRFSGSGTVDVRLLTREYNPEHARWSTLMPGEGSRFILHSKQDLPMGIKLRNITGEITALSLAELNQDVSGLHPQFLKAIEPYSFLRFMDFTATNNSEAVNWEMRVLPAENQGVEGRGCSWDWVKRIAKVTGKAIWINVPHMANDDYIHELAKFFSDVQCIVEHSNEVWNTMFKQAGYAIKKASEQGITPMAWHGQRSQHIWDIWSKYSSNFIKVLGTQNASVGRTKEALAHCEPDRISVAPYFGESLTADQSLFNKPPTLIAELMYQDFPWDWLKQHLDLGIDVNCYEGGPHLRAAGIPDKATTNRFINEVMIPANRSNAMRSVYYDSLKRMNELGVREYCAFNLAHNVSAAGDWGIWGTPKEQALHDFINDHKLIDLPAETTPPVEEVSTTEQIHKYISQIRHLAEQALKLTEGGK